MRGTQVTLFVIGLMILGTQSLRHVYVKWIEPTSSVLDQYRPPIAEDLTATQDLDELVAIYESARQKVEAYEETASLEEIDLSKRTGREAYMSEQVARSAIERWEAQSKSPWLGMVGIITGFTEMAVWTSPLWRSWGPQGQFERLLNQKLLLSLVSVALLVGLWLWNARRTSAGAADPDSSRP